MYLGYFTLTQDWGNHANLIFTKRPPQVDP